MHSVMSEYIIPNGRLTTFIGTNAVAKKGNEVNSFYIGMYTMLSGLAMITLTLAAAELLLNMVPKSAAVLHEKLLKTVMGAPLSFFTSTDTGTTTNRQVLRLFVS
jgi:ATP-binding cassette subfamily C (CFTR/MRP) protein 1